MSIEELNSIVSELCIHHLFCFQVVQISRENKMKAVRLGKWSERPDDLFQLMAKYAYLPDVKVSSVVFLVAVTNDRKQNVVMKFKFKPYRKLHYIFAAD